MRVLAIDQGTTTTRAILVTPEGASPLFSLPHAQLYPQAGWVEHDAQELLANIRTCLNAGAAHVPDVVAITNQGESCLAWDAITGTPASPVIVWQDDRTAADVAALGDAAALVRTRAGLPMDPYFSASKLAWLLRHNADVQALARAGRLRLGTTDAFFRQHLTGRCETDAATASRTALMNLTTLAWDADLAALWGVPQDWLPPIGPSVGDLGCVQVGDRLVPLTASIVDQQAALAGHGCMRPGEGKITFGTGAFALVLTGATPVMAAGGALPTLAWAVAGEPPVYALDGGVYAASAAVNWARSLGLFRDWAEINAFDRPPAIARGLAFVPALAGLACPHWDRAARGAFMGLSLDSTAQDMMQAMLEGVAFRMAEVMAVLDAAQPPQGVLSIDGGMSRNPAFCQVLADTLARPLRIADEAELTAVGAAALAAQGAFSPPMTGTIISPQPQPPAWAESWARARAAVQSFAPR